MNPLQHNRFKDLPWYPKESIDVLIGGAGGIGSWTAFLLARAGFKPFVMDFDTIEAHNLGGQLYPKSSIGTKKVKALSKVIAEFSDEEIMIFDQEITKETASNKYVISAFDNMEARKDMFESWVAINTINDKNDVEDKEALFIDGRLNVEQFWIYCVTIDKIEDYRKTLFASSEIPDEACTAKQTSHIAALIAGHIVSFFTNHYTNVIEKDNDRVVPFMYEYFSPLVMFNTE